MEASRVIIQRFRPRLVSPLPVHIFSSVDSSYDNNCFFITADACKQSIRRQVHIDTIFRSSGTPSKTKNPLLVFRSSSRSLTAPASISSSHSQTTSRSPPSNDVKVETVKIDACGDVDDDEDEDDDDEMEQEEMFVEAYDSPSFDHRQVEWGGPRRGGRLPEPTRFGDWERKGRCSDF